MKRLSILLVCIIILVSVTACDSNVVKGTIIQNSDNGYAILDILPQKLFEIANVGESVIITVGDFRKEMSLVDDLAEEDGKLQLYYNSAEHSLNIVSYNQNFCEIYSIPVNSKVKIQKP